MAKKNCWEIINCDDDMREGCGHYNSTDLCPLNCWFALCKSPKRHPVDDPALIFNRGELPTPARIECLECKQYLENAVPGGPNAKDYEYSVGSCAVGIITDPKGDENGNES